MKMKVGDIEMDSESGISFDSSDSEKTERALERRDESGAPVEQHPEQTPELKHSSLVEWTDEHRGFVKIVGSGSAVLAVGMTAMAFAAGSAYFALPAFMWLLWSAGAAYLIRHADSTIEEQVTAERAPLLEDAQEVRRALMDDAAERRVDEIRDQLEWSEERAVRALAAGVEEGILREDLDASTEHWVYSAASTAELEGESLPKEAIPATERAKQLEN